MDKEFKELNESLDQPINTEFVLVRVDEARYLLRMAHKYNQLVSTLEYRVRDIAELLGMKL